MGMSTATMFFLKNVKRNRENENGILILTQYLVLCIHCSKHLKCIKVFNFII